MSARRAQSLPPHMLEPPLKPERGRCVSAICFSWKVLTCIVSHVTLVLLVVSYCVGGAYLFQHLEKPHEIEVKKGIKNLRHNLTEKIWRFSDDVLVLAETDWINSVKGDLANFEKQILTAMKTDGWDGNEDITKSQWTFAGSLFYSIIVITTIGYGHISPRTDWGKVTTIFYAIVGIPLMLLCLSTIGDVMATSFRFIYWRVCCYVCTRTARRPRQRSRQRSMRSHRNSARSQPPPATFRRSMKLTQRSANDSGFGASMGLPHAYSDPELRTVGRNDYDRDYSRSLGGSGHSRGSGARGQQRRQPYHYDQQPQRSGGHRSIYDEDYDVNYTSGGHRQTQTLNRNTRLSSRQRNRDRMRDRHTVEREHHFNRSRQNLQDDDDSMDDFRDMQPPVKRTLSVRSTRSPYIAHDEPTRGSQDSRASRELNRLHSHQSHVPQPRGRSVPNTPRGRAKSAGPRTVSAHYDDVDEELARKIPIISNRYALDDFEHAMGDGSQSRRRNGGNYGPRSQSMPRSAHQRQHNGRGHTPQPHGGRGHTPQPHAGRAHTPQPQQQSQPPRHRSLGRQQSRYGNQLELPDYTPQTAHMNHVRRGRSPRRYDPGYDMEDMDDCSVKDYDCERGDRGSAIYEDYSPRQRERDREPERRQRRQRAERLPPSPRIMSPMGFPVQRQIYRRRPSYDYDDDSLYGDEYGEYCSDLSPKERPVPIWLCVFLVISYILGGAILFAYWEEWSFLDSAYFCFITLTTIGFGDFVPAKGVKDESEQSIAYCSLYLLFGIALLAMSFNLVQEEFINNVKEVARRLGILRDEEDDD